MIGASRSRVLAKMRSQRTAYTLIQMVAVMVFAGTLMSLCGIAIHRMSLLQRLALRSIRYEKQIADLYRHIKSDSRQAQQARLSDDTIVLESDLNRVEYSADRSQIVRKQFVAAGQLQGINRWNFEDSGLLLQHELESSERLLKIKLLMPPKNAYNSFEATQTVLQSSTHGPQADNQTEMTESKTVKDSLESSADIPLHNKNYREVVWYFRLRGQP